LLIGYMTLFSIINPFGLAFVFYARNRSLSEPARGAVARRIALNSFVILVVSMFIGSQVLRFLGISIPALRIAGGWSSPCPAGPCSPRRTTRAPRRRPMPAPPRSRA
jgi:multiple antibiotic resistance protein